jgi:hypothetical protein
MISSADQEDNKGQQCLLWWYKDPTVVDECKIVSGDTSSSANMSEYLHESLE